MKRILLCLALALLLTGCASILEQSYVAVTPHDKRPAAEVDAAAIRVEDYPGLVSAIYDLVAAGAEEGTVRLHNYPREEDAAGDLTAACNEVSREDPLGAYAVDFIKPELKRIVTYYEATLTISYRRTAEQMNAIVPVIGGGAIRAALAEALAEYAPEIALRVSYFSDDEAYIKSLVHRAYYDNPAAAQGLPQVNVTLYPDSGAQRIVEVTLTYPQSADALRKQSTETAEAAAELLLALGKAPGGEESVSALFEALGALGDGAGSKATAHAALVTGNADSEGMALGFKLLCDGWGVGCEIVRGADSEGNPRFWTIVALGDEYRHVDPSSPDGLLLSDRALTETGYVWSREDYPLCGEQPTDPAAADPTETSGSNGENV